MGSQDRIATPLAMPVTAPAKCTQPEEPELLYEVRAALGAILAENNHIRVVRYLGNVRVGGFEAWLQSAAVS